MLVRTAAHHSWHRCATLLLPECSVFSIATHGTGIEHVAMDTFGMLFSELCPLPCASSRLSALCGAVLVQA